MSKVFVVDLGMCNGCHNCQVACKDEHCEQPWLPYAAAQPMVGQFWMNVVQRERGQVPTVRVSYIPTFCNHCADAPCTDVCPAGAIVRREDGLTYIDPKLCTGCGNCVDACPIGAVYFNEEDHIAQKCTGCAHLLDNGWEVPRCVDACPTEAIRYIEESEAADVIAGATQFEELEGRGSKVYYLKFPKRFVAGLVADFAAGEVVIGAKATLKDADGAVIATQETDDFGDFIFDQIEPAAYTVDIEADGYEGITVLADVTDIDVRIPDIDLKRIA